MPSQFEQQLAASWPPTQWQRVPVVVAVSGGADSVALLRGLVSLANTDRAGLIVAHFNHQLRSDSADDAEFVAELCNTLGVRCERGQADRDLTEASDGSIEQAAREARYEFLLQTAQRTGARYIATAHTADDQTETILHRIIRGTGLRGLAGIPASREILPGITLMRPLLSIRRTAIVSYLEEIEQPFCSDSSNLDLKFTRNRIRNSLLPLLRSDYNGQVDDSLRQLGHLADEATAYLESVAIELFDRAVECTSDVATIDLAPLAECAPLIVRTMLRHVWRSQHWSERDMTFDHWHQLGQLVTTPLHQLDRTTINLPADIRATLSEQQLTIKNNGQP